MAWLCCIVLAFAFARAGFDKFSANGGFAGMFVQWGYPAWFRIGVGATEVAAAGLLLWPRFARWGALAVLGVMFGAMATRIVHGQADRILSAELLPTVLAVGVLLLRWPRPGREVSG
jgi:uncharacterized membrane protein YphA (DoxX/SURF4 family)